MNASDKAEPMVPSGDMRATWTVLCESANQVSWEPTPPTSAHDQIASQTFFDGAGFGVMLRASQGRP